MSTDCYTFTWDAPGDVAVAAIGENHRPRLPDWAKQPLGASASRLLTAAEPVDMTVILGFKSHYLGIEIPNDRIAELVNKHSDRLVGFAGVDPSSPREALSELQRARSELGLKGLAIAPAAQDFHPTNTHAMRLYAEAAERGMPILFHSGITITSATKLEYAQPVLLDEVARELPTLKMVIAHMGHPWTHETVVLLAKHPNVYAEISWILNEPWQAHQALLHAHQFGVMDKLLFGSGFPVSTASRCIETLYGLNHLVHGTNLPTIPRESLRGIVERDALALLGITVPRGVDAAGAAAPSSEPEEIDALLAETGR